MKCMKEKVQKCVVLKQLPYFFIGYLSPVLFNNVKKYNLLLINCKTTEL